MKSNFMKTVAILLLLLLLAGCATNVNFNTNPEGAEVYVNGNFVGVTPVKAKVYDDSLLKIVKLGYKDLYPELKTEIKFGRIILAPFTYFISLLYMYGPSRYQNFILSPIVEAKYNVSISREKDSYLEVDVVPSVNEDGKITDFLCRFTNNSNNVAKIIWSESGVNYGGLSYKPFIGGQRYIDDNKPMPPTIIASKETVHEKVLSNGQVYKTNTLPIQADEIRIIICAEYGNESEYITVHIIREEVKNQ